MLHKLLVSGAILVACSVPTFAATAAAGFYVAQDAKTHQCMVSDAKPDGKTMMDVGTKVYAAKPNAEQAMANLKACASVPAAAAATKPAAAATKPAAMAPAKPAAMAPAKPAAGAMATAGFYVEQDAKTKKCMVATTKPDGKMMMDVGTKVYAAEGNAKQAMANLKACKN